jgi:hypothetical protein
MELLPPLQNWRGQVVATPGSNTWLHHAEFAERTEQLAGHLNAILRLAEESRFASAMVIARTALEHHLIDRLLLLADRYVEIVRPQEPADIEQWERDWAAKTEPWTQDVAQVERVRGGKALRLVRLGHSVRDSNGIEQENISPYWVALDQHDAFLGRPATQLNLARPFDDPDESVKSARRNQAIYEAFLKWGSLRSNLELSDLTSPFDLLQLEVHYTFLSAFTHATKSGYELDRRSALPNSPNAMHVFSELALLYVAVIAVAQIDTWVAYMKRRPQLLMKPSRAVLDRADRARAIIGYFWFLGGDPQSFDFYQEANRRARPVLLSGSAPTVMPDLLHPSEVSYYANPFDRLRRLHVGEREIATGFAFAPMWNSLHW